MTTQSPLQNTPLDAILSFTETDSALEFTTGNVRCGRIAVYTFVAINLCVFAYIACTQQFLWAVAALLPVLIVPRLQVRRSFLFDINQRQVVLREDTISRTTELSWPFVDIADIAAVRKPSGNPGGRWHWHLIMKLESASRCIHITHRVMSGHKVPTRLAALVSKLRSVVGLDPLSQ